MAAQTKMEFRAKLKNILGGKRLKQDALVAGEPVYEADEAPRLPVLRSATMPVVATEALSSHPVILPTSRSGSVCHATSSLSETSFGDFSGFTILDEVTAASPSICTSPEQPHSAVEAGKESWSKRSTPTSGDVLDAYLARLEAGRRTTIHVGGLGARPANPVVNRASLPAGRLQPTIVTTSSDELGRATHKQDTCKIVRRPRPRSKVAPRSPDAMWRGSVSSPVAGPAPFAGMTTTESQTALLKDSPLSYVGQPVQPSGRRIRSVSYTPPSPIAEEGGVGQQRPASDAGAWSLMAASGPTVIGPQRAQAVAVVAAAGSSTSTSTSTSSSPILAAMSQPRRASEAPVRLPSIKTQPSLLTLLDGPTWTPAIVPQQRFSRQLQIYELDGEASRRSQDGSGSDDDDSVGQSATSEVSSSGLSELSSAPSSIDEPEGNISPMTPNSTKQYKAFRLAPESFKRAVDLGPGSSSPAMDSKAACEAWVRRSQFLQMGDRTVPLKRHIPQC